MKLGEEDSSHFKKYSKRSNLDISDIDGSRPQIGRRVNSEKKINFVNGLQNVHNAEEKGEMEKMRNRIRTESR